MSREYGSIASATAGAAVFAQLHEFLIPLLYDPTNVGQLTLADWAGSRGAAVVTLAVVFSICIYFIGKLWTRQGGNE